MCGAPTLCALHAEGHINAHAVKIRANTEDGNTYTSTPDMKKGSCMRKSISKHWYSERYSPQFAYTPPFLPNPPRLRQILHGSSSRPGEGINRVLLLSVVLRFRWPCRRGLWGASRPIKSDGGREKGERTAARRQIMGRGRRRRGGITVC